MNHLLARANFIDTETRPFEELLRLPELRAIRMLLAKPIFGHLVDELTYSMRLDVISREEDRAVLKEKGGLFVLRLEGEQWRCRC